MMEMSQPRARPVPAGDHDPAATSCNNSRASAAAEATAHVPPPAQEASTAAARATGVGALVDNAVSPSLPALQATRQAEDIRRLYGVNRA